MSLPIPRLDDRSFDDLVQEAKNKIPSLCRQWTDFNDSDPGITLIHLMAYMGEAILYRLNRVPERNYLKFLELMGVQRKPSKPARTWVVFELTPGAEEGNMQPIPKGTNLSTRPEGGEAVKFQTCDALNLTTARPVHLFARHGEHTYDHSDCLLPPDPQGKQDKAVQLFDKPIDVPHAALYLALDKQPSNNVHRLYFDIKAPPDIPPSQMKWEYKTHEGWEALSPSKDETNALTREGGVEYTAPSDWQSNVEMGHTGYWLRGLWEVDKFPQHITLSGVYTNAVKVVQTKTLHNEILGSGEDTPLQIVTFSEAPLLPDVGILVREKASWVKWEKVDTFFKSGPDDRHYCFDPIEGKIQFGDGRHGRKAPSGNDNIKADFFKLCDGARGNVGAGVINVLEQNIKYVKSVKNIKAARGGTDIETLEAARKRGPWALKHRDRAVTRQDFEQLAREASTEVALAHCIKTLSSDDEVQVLILPSGKSSPKDKPQPSKQLIEHVEKYLSARCLINTRLKIMAPKYVDCKMDVKVVLKSSHLGQFTHVSKEIKKKIKDFVHPLTGGPDGEGWPMGRTVHISEMFYLLEQIDGIDYVDEILMSKRASDESTDNNKIKLPGDAFPYFKDIKPEQLTP